jgi:hypothetical protein
MSKLLWSEALGRKIRQDDPAGLAVPNRTVIRDAVQAGRTQEALDLIDYTLEQDEANNDSLVLFVDKTLGMLAGLGEEHIEKLLLDSRAAKIKDWLSKTPDALGTLQRCTEMQRRHYGNYISIVEEADRYVAVLDPCGTGGRLWRKGNPACTKKGYPWSWGRAGVPYYCLHCSMQWEIIPIELRGYPLRITEIGAGPQDPCVHLFYKKPELIPEKYFTRIGKVKTIK